MRSIGVIVGRFQAPFMHQGYVQFLGHVREKHEDCMVVIGVSQTRGTKRDPLDAMTRLAMLGQHSPGFKYAQIGDRESDKAWSAELDRLICEAYPWAAKRGAKVVLYGGRDSFLPRYHGRFKTQLFKSTLGVASTKIREQVGKQAPAPTWKPEEIEYFSRGIIYAAQNAFPRTFPTVDIAVTRFPTPGTQGKVHLLLGRKFKTDEFVRFPGGFVDPTDESLEMAAKREIMEEAPGIATEGPMVYVGSMLVDDWRYRGPDRIMTSLFHTEYTWGHTQAGDDLAEVEWYPFGKQTRNKIAPLHQPLYDMLVKYMKETFLKEQKMQEFEAANQGWK